MLVPVIARHYRRRFWQPVTQSTAPSADYELKSTAGQPDTNGVFRTPRLTKNQKLVSIISET